MGYNWKPLPVQPVHVEIDKHALIHLSPASGRGHLLAYRWADGEWHVVREYEGPLDIARRALEEELEPDTLAMDLAAYRDDRSSRHDVL
jgi:hypothetical protein